MTAESKLKIREIEFKKVFESYFPSLCVFANKFVRDEDLAKDLVQDVFVKIWNNETEFDSERSMKVYFYLATKNTCFDYLKKQKRRGFTEELNEEVQIEDDYVVNEIVREETYRQLEGAIELLPEKAREILRLNLQGLSNPEIAEELNVSINTVKTHKLHAFRKLRELFGEQYVIFLLVEFYHFL
ncbi:RNA polymerase sigma-70 factor [Marinifilum breve]|uniref:RNA polymerase sigma-70 factor n=1 Tax=Marinifilum breve TaxID=2184082 RepID=A0A2V3ZRA6_9BACT|nr:RNA polymerase sigma-70 factor [Marinifilum breve]PXX95390.1 RNA polymerase sigma-70 factor [Marinifilum breve]